MAKIVGVFRAVERWCGKEPEFGSDKLRDLWEEHGPSGVPFDSAGAELLIDILDQEFTDRPMLLRAVDILELTVSGLVDAVPDGPAEISMDVAATGGRAALAAPTPPASVKSGKPEKAPSPASPPAPRSPLVVTLSDDSIERLATRLTAHLAPHLAAEEKPQEKKPQEKKPLVRGGREAAEPKKTKTTKKGR